MTALSPGLAGLLDRLCDDRDISLGKARELAGILCGHLIELELKDSEGHDLGAYLWSLADDLREMLDDLGCAPRSP
jgi:hypothetical protein